MKLKDVWKKKEVTLSFEAFPPKKDSDFASVASAVEKIAQLKPDFMSVTYGAGGGTSAYTGKIAQIVQAQGVTALALAAFLLLHRERIFWAALGLAAAWSAGALALAALAHRDFAETLPPAALAAALLTYACTVLRHKSLALPLAALVCAGLLCLLLWRARAGSLAVRWGEVFSLSLIHI